MNVDLSQTVRNFSRDFTRGNNFGSESRAICALQGDLFQATKKLQDDTIAGTLDPSKGGDPQEKIALLARVNLAISYARMFFENMIEKAKEDRKQYASTFALAKPAQA